MCLIVEMPTHALIRGLLSLHMSHLCSTWHPVKHTVAMVLHVLLFIVLFLSSRDGLFLEPSLRIVGEPLMGLRLDGPKLLGHFAVSCTSAASEPRCSD